MSTVSSGSDVASASRMLPTINRPKPVKSAIASPNRVSATPAATITAADSTNCSVATATTFSVNAKGGSCGTPSRTQLTGTPADVLAAGGALAGIHQSGQIVAHQLSDPRHADVRVGVPGQHLWIVGIVALAWKDGRESRPPELFGRGENAQLVVDQDVVFGREARFDVGQLLVPCECRSRRAPRPPRTARSVGPCAAGRRRRRRSG